MEIGRPFVCCRFCFVRQNAKQASREMPSSARPRTAAAPDGPLAWRAELLAVSNSPLNSPCYSPQSCQLLFTSVACRHSRALLRLPVTLRRSRRLTQFHSLAMTSSLIPRTLAVRSVYNYDVTNSLDVADVITLYIRSTASTESPAGEIKIQKRPYFFFRLLQYTSTASSLLHSPCFLLAAACYL